MKVRVRDDILWKGHNLPTKGWVLFSKSKSDKMFVQKISEDGIENLSEEVEIPKSLLNTVLI